MSVITIVIRASFTLSVSIKAAMTLSILTVIENNGSHPKIACNPIMERLNCFQ